jgi:formylmethanofuran dehydrogenase subunit C
MLSLTLKTRTTLPLELSELRPDKLRELSHSEIEKIFVVRGREKLPLAEVFTVKGDCWDEQIEFSGDLSSGRGIGTGMTNGRIRVAGHAGNYVGLGMFAGEIEITSNAGQYLGAEMRGGLIRVAGSAGDYAGGAQPGSTRGMTGGTIVVKGDAGNFVGTRMRRGLIAARGNVCSYAGYNRGRRKLRCSCRSEHEPRNIMDRAGDKKSAADIQLRMHVPTSRPRNDCP